MRQGILWGVIGLAGGAVLTATLANQYEYQLAPVWYEVAGVDVSNHQGAIDWSALAGAKVMFAYIKATEGGDFKDKRFTLNWEGAKKAGVARGAYHFFTQCRTGLEQANNFISTVPRESGALAPVIDAEHMGPCRTGQQISSVVNEITTMLGLLEAHYGRRPLIYTSSDFDALYFQGQLAGEKFWVRSMFWPPAFRTEQWLIWQYHDAGTRPGVSGPIDLNVFRGSRGRFAAFLAGET